MTYHEIDEPIVKKDEIAAWFEGLTVIVHTGEADDYATMPPEHAVIEVMNPYRQASLFIEITEEFSLYFAGWHTHFAPYEEDLLSLKKAVFSIFADKLGAIVLTLDGRWCASGAVTEEFAHDRDILLRLLCLDEESKREYVEGGALLTVAFWTKETTISLKED